MNHFIRTIFQATVKMFPPSNKLGLTDQFKPRREHETVIRKHFLEFVFSHVKSVLNLIPVDVQVYVRGDEEYVVDWL